jgi:hypothetical protein
MLQLSDTPLINTPCAGFSLFVIKEWPCCGQQFDWGTRLQLLNVRRPHLQIGKTPSKPEVFQRSGLLVCEYYITIPIDDNNVRWYYNFGNRKCAASGICQAKPSGEFRSTVHGMCLDQVQCSSGARKYIRRCQVVLICPHWLRVSPFRCANPVGQRSRSAR